MDEAELKRLEDLCAKASPAPWTFERVGGSSVDNINCAAPIEDPDSDFPPSRAVVVTDSGHYPPRLPDADFIAAARTALPAALAEVRRLNVLVAMNAALLDASTITAAFGDEIVRLRGLVKAAEWSGDGMHEGFVGCNWCSASYDHGGGADIAKHADDCPAFTPGGAVR